MTVLIDSDILIEVSRARNDAIVSKWTELSESDAFILFSPVTAAELVLRLRVCRFERLCITAVSLDTYRSACQARRGNVVWYLVWRPQRLR